MGDQLAGLSAGNVSGEDAHDVGAALGGEGDEFESVPWGVG